MSSVARADFSTEADRYPPPVYAAYLVAVLFVVTLSSFLDRSLPTLMVEPIRKAFTITNTQFGYLQGTGFAVTYALAGLPLGRLVDRVNRRNLILVGLLAWSVTTAAAVFAHTYWQFFATRMGVGIGEACLAPAAYSMIADCVPPRRRARTISVYYVSLAVGSGASLLLGGLILRLAPPGGVLLPFMPPLPAWRVAFLAAAAPALVLMPLLLTIREPLRREERADSAPIGPAAVSFPTYLRRHPTTFILLFAGPALFALIGYASLAWAPTHYLRRFGIPTVQSSPVIGVLLAVVGVFGSLASGTLSDRWLGKGLSAARLRVMVLAWSLALPAAVAWPLIGSPVASYVLFGVTIFTASLGQAATPIIIQDVTPNRMRGQAIATYLLVASLLGGGLGPAIPAWLTDSFFHNDGALGLSLALLAGFAACGGLITTLLALGPYARLRCAVAE